MKYYRYEDFRADTNKLITMVKSFEPHAIVAIARGGLTLGHTMAEALNIREVQTLRTELYDNTSKRDSISIFGQCRFIEKKRVLVVDDISDSGETLKEIMHFLKEENKGVEFRSATLFYKETSIYEPNYWINKADEWIDFFWERDFKTTLN
jgi:xanthine phosphoribosyltransferase